MVQKTVLVYVRGGGKMPLTSCMLSKNEIKYIQNLSVKKARQQAGCFLIEGPKLLDECMASCPSRLLQVYAVAEWISSNASRVPSNAQVTEIADFELEKISHLQTPQRVVGLVALPKVAEASPPANQWSLLLNDIQDPGNLGNILRTAEWFGWQPLFCTPASADVFSPKVVQASMGAVLRLPVHYSTGQKLMAGYGGPIYGSFMSGKPVCTSDQLPPGILIIGNEGRGISNDLLPFITAQISIAGSGAGESLNAAMAAGILMALLSQ